MQIIFWHLMQFKNILPFGLSMTFLNCSLNNYGSAAPWRGYDAHILSGIAPSCAWNVYMINVQSYARGRGAHFFFTRQFSHFRQNIHTSALVKETTDRFSFCRDLDFPLNKHVAYEKPLGMCRSKIAVTLAYNHKSQWFLWFCKEK